MEIIKQKAPEAALNHDIIRGVLIFIVILDHNDIIRNVHSVNVWFQPMTFHVAGFLLLPFLVPPRPLSFNMARNYAVRYLVPFLFALIGYAAAFQILIEKQGFSIDWLKDLAIAFLFADPWSLQKSTGFVVLWFLPALLSLVLLSAMFHSSQRPFSTIIFVFSIFVHLTVGAATITLKTSVPQALLIALYIFPLGLIMRYVMPWLIHRRRRVWVVVVALSGLLASWAFERGTEVEVATLIVPTLLQPLWVIATDFSNLSFLVIVIIISPILLYVPGLALLGRYSLLIYLLHPILYKPVLDVMLQYCTVVQLETSTGRVLYWMGAAASVVAVAGASLTLAMIVQRWPLLRSLITPRGIQDWLPITSYRAVRLRWS